MYNNDFINLDLASVSGILSRGGTILYSSNKDNLFDYQVEENGIKVKKDVSDVAVENMKKENVVLCGASAYEEKYYLNPDFEQLPQGIKDELKIMCVLYVHDVGGILTLVFDEDGELNFEVTAEEGDPMFDEIGSHLKIKQLQREKEELLEALQMFYRVFLMGEEL